MAIFYIIHAENGACVDKKEFKVSARDLNDARGKWEQACPDRYFVLSIKEGEGDWLRHVCNKYVSCDGFCQSCKDEVSRMGV